MTLDQIISIIICIATFITAFTSLFVLFQNYKQRQASYKPQLALKNIRFEATSGNTLYVPEIWKTQDNTMSRNGFCLPLVNIGLGSAIQINAEWFFDFETYIPQLNQSAQKALISAYLEYKDGILGIKSDTIQSSFNYWKNQKIQKIDYIIPVSNNGNAIDLFFPSAIKLALSSACYFYQINTSKDSTNKDSALLDFPKIILNLSYFDIGNTKHRECFEIKVHVCALSLSKGSQCEFSGYFETVKKQ